MDNVPKNAMKVCGARTYMSISLVSPMCIIQKCGKSNFGQHGVVYKSVFALSNADKILGNRKSLSECDLHLVHGFAAL